MLQDVLSDIRGTVTGKSKVVGNLKRPDIIGELVVNNGGFNIPYLNVDLDFENNAIVKLQNQSFIFDKIVIACGAFSKKLTDNLSNPIRQIIFHQPRVILKMDYLE